MANDLIDSLEARNEIQQVDFPELTIEQKNKILMLQRQILSIQVNINNLQKQLEQLGPALNNLLLNIATEMHINAQDFSFNLESMSFIPSIRA